MPASRDLHHSAQEGASGAGSSVGAGWCLATRVFPRQEDLSMATSSDQVVLGSPAPEFSLRGTDGRVYSLEDLAGERGTVIVFICNHCPYVKAVIGRLVSRDRRTAPRRPIILPADGP